MYSYVLIYVILFFLLQNDIQRVSIRWLIPVTLFDLSFKQFYLKLCKSYIAFTVKTD